MGLKGGGRRRAAAAAGYGGSIVELVVPLMETWMGVIPDQDRSVLGGQGGLLSTRTAVLDGILQRLAELGGVFVTVNLDCVLHRHFHELAPTLPDYKLFEGSWSWHLAPRLLVAFGEDRERYQRAEELQKYSGIAPVTERSGKKSWVHWRWQCPTFLRQTFIEWASQTINKSFWAGAYYHQQRAKGSTYQAAVRALAFKWIRILYACWKTRTPYDESKYLNALKRRGSPLLNNLVPDPLNA